VIAPSGTVVNPELPAPVAARGLTGFRLANAVFGALAQVAPDRVPAAESGGDTGISIGGYDAQRRPFVYLEFLFGGWGGRPDRDGIDGCASMVVNFANNPIEMVEASQPLRIERYGFVPDSGGAGQFRGGLALVKEYRFLEEEGVLQIRSDRHCFRPYGLAGGGPGAPASNVLNPGTDGERTLPSKTLLRIKRGDLLRHTLAGAGGYGDPRRRAPDRLRDDLRNGKVTPEAASRDYGAVPS
jgi:N-methylhydantoinase B